MDVTSQNFIPLAKIGIENESLQSSMQQFGKNMAARRIAAATALPEFERLRDEAKDIKNHTLSHLDLYLERFEEQVIAKGGTVHWASSEDEARDIILGICRRDDAKLITKSKSMVTEELDLVPFLAEAGLESVETDLGEYIIQLRSERPSHIVAPAVHLNKDQVAETFFEHHKTLGFNEKLNERSDLVAQARQVLREKFLTADVGITGANFIVAETGTVVLVTNEGNAELTTSLPKTHIVVTGIEKLVPTLEDASTFVRLLARSAVGAEISTYTSFITGKKKFNDLDGPENFHVVLVDNGRTDMLGSEYQDMLRCIRCSACLHHCPVYLSVGGHAYGSVYNGPMGAVLTPQLANFHDAAHLPNASTFCGKCEDVCPVRIPLPKLMRQWRNEEFQRKLNSRSMRWGLRVWAFLCLHPRLYHLVTGFFIWVLSKFGREKYLQYLPFLGGNWTEERDLRRPRGRSFQSLLKEKIRV